jgi:hypothetical protein
MSKPVIFFGHALSFFGQMFSKILNTCICFSVNSINFANFNGEICKKIDITNLRKNTNPGLNSWSSLIPTRHTCQPTLKVSGSLSTLKKNPNQLY